MLKLIAVMGLVVLGLSACATPEYKNHAVRGTSTKAMDPNDVNFKVSGAFYNDPPRCVAVLPAKGKDSRKMEQLISIALARYLGEKIDRVIFPRKSGAIAKKQGYDLENHTDLKRFGRHTRCRFVARASLYDLGDDYAVVFSKKHVGLKLDLVRIQDKEPFWQAAHTVWRAEGGVPMSPLGAVGGVVRATAFNQDKEILPSMVDDAMRRMIRTLPMAGI